MIPLSVSVETKGLKTEAVACSAALIQFYLFPNFAKKLHHCNIVTTWIRIKECIRTLSRGGMYWEINPTIGPRTARFSKGRGFAPREVFLALEKALRHTVPWAVFPNTLHREQGV